MGKSPSLGRGADSVGGSPQGDVQVQVALKDLKSSISKFNGKLKLQHVQAGLFTLRAFDISPEERPQCIEELSRKENALREGNKQVGSRALDAGSPSSPGL